MCIRHWRLVPAPLRRAVLDAFARWRRAVARARYARTRESLDPVATLGKALREAQQMAINAVLEKEIRRDLKRQEGQTPLPLKV